MTINVDHTNEEPIGTVIFVGWNMAKQIAIDDQDRVWCVSAWYDIDGDEITDRWINPDQIAIDTTYNVNEENWEYVDFVTVYYDFPEGRKWSSIRPDDFDRPTEG